MYFVNFHGLCVYSVGQDLDLLNSYQRERVQRIDVDYTRSSRCEVSMGVPEGSILGPFLFTSRKVSLTKAISYYIMYSYDLIIDTSV